jgi:hypothetical protein
MDRVSRTLLFFVLSIQSVGCCGLFFLRVISPTSPGLGSGYTFSPFLHPMGRR